MASVNPIKETITPVPRLPTHVIVYKNQASPYWWFRFYRGNNRYRKGSTRTDDKNKAFAFARESYNSFLLEDASDKNNVPITFRAAAQSLLKQEEASGKTSLHQKSKHQLEKHIYENLGQLRVSEITHNDLNQFLLVLKKQDYAPATKKHYMGLAHKVLAHAVELGALDRLPLFPKLGEKLLTQQKRDYFTMSQYQALSKKIISLEKEGMKFNGVPITSEFKILVNFMINSFIRPSDLRVLRHQHITKRSDATDKTEWLTLSHPATKTTAMEVQTMPNAVVHYNELIKFREAQFKSGEAAKKYTDADDYLFLPSYKNRDTAIKTIGRVFSFIIKQSGLEKKTGKHFTLYSLRHTAIMFRLINSDIDTLALAINARTSQGVIEKFYGAHLTTEQSRQKLHSFRSRASKASPPN